MNNTKNENSTNLNGCWYFPIINKEHNEMKADDNSLDIKSELEKIEGYEVLPINIMNEKGKVDEYLADLISELWYVASFIKIYIDKEGFLDSKTMEKFEEVNEIHADIIFLKKVYFQEMYELNRLKRYVSSQSDSIYMEEYLLRVFEKYEERLRKYSFEDSKFSPMLIELKNRYYYSYYPLRDQIYYDLKNSKVDKKKVIEHINRTKGIWTMLYYIFIVDATIFSLEDELVTYNNLVDRMNDIDKSFGNFQIQCCTCLALSDATKYVNLMTHSDRIRSFKKLISSDSRLRKEYTGKKAKRCYSQMWIDNCSTQYFALSCGPDYGNAELYYETAKELLSQCINYNSHCKYDPVLFTKEMRYYRSNRLGDYVEYNDVEKMLSIEELRQGFSCCERKLLTKVEELSGKNALDNKNVHIFVKYSPCIICERALDAYEKHGFNFEIIELEKYAGKKSKYLDLDIKIKKLEA